MLKGSFEDIKLPVLKRMISPGILCREEKAALYTYISWINFKSKSWIVCQFYKK